MENNTQNSNYIVIYDDYKIKINSNQMAQLTDAANSDNPYAVLTDGDKKLILSLDFLFVVPEDDLMKESCGCGCGGNCNCH